ncbi:MAG: citrate lyase acyl carrier protein [Spirochaetae bacterium HGW-Spirochaetae-7]|jgi:citrate lyase subunit gamma (acyl carrier protein)|nr:MAG: citrate lyase acyl carrier protein [Spirochaetae bacterium HGW-Spirochaetae-7]
MNIVHEASSGTNESGDARITVSPNPSGGLSLELRGPSVARYGDDIRAAALSTLGSLGVTDATVSITEKGALDATIRARLAAACGRAADVGVTPWEAFK